MGSCLRQSDWHSQHMRVSVHSAHASIQCVHTNTDECTHKHTHKRTHTCTYTHAHGHILSDSSGLSGHSWELHLALLNVPDFLFSGLSWAFSQGGATSIPFAPFNYFLF